MVSACVFILSCSCVCSHFICVHKNSLQQQQQQHSQCECVSVRVVRITSRLGSTSNARPRQADESALSGKSSCELDGSLATRCAALRLVTRRGVRPRSLDVALSPHLSASCQTLLVLSRFLGAASTHHSVAKRLSKKDILVAFL